MKTILLISARTISYWFIGVILFLFIVNFIEFPKDKIKNSDNLVNKIENKIQDPKKIVLDSINPTYKIESNIKNIIDYFVFFEYILDNTNKVIPMFYILMFLTFILQITLLALSNYYEFLIQFFSEKKLDNIFLYSSEFSVNVPTILGVMGTIFSFGIVVSSSSDVSNISTIFKANFANSALTTIIGGMIYILNLYINIFITKNLSIQK